MTRSAFRYIEEANPGGFRPAPLPATLSLVGGADGAPSLDLSYLPDAWILSRLAAAVGAINAHLGAYEIALAVQAVYDFWYKDLCDVYLESIKPVRQRDALPSPLTSPYQGTPYIPLRHAPSRSRRGCGVRGV